MARCFEKMLWCWLFLTASVSISPAFFPPRWKQTHFQITPCEPAQRPCLSNSRKTPVEGRGGVCRSRPEPEPGRGDGGTSCHGAGGDLLGALRISALEGHHWGLRPLPPCKQTASQLGHPRSARGKWMENPIAECRLKVCWL